MYQKWLLSHFDRFLSLLNLNIVEDVLGSPMRTPPDFP